MTPELPDDDVFDVAGSLAAPVVWDIPDVLPTPVSAPRPPRPTERGDRPSADGVPGEMLPQADERRAAPVRRTAPPSRRLRPGDLVCGDCGEGNLPSRKFCSRCGASLETAVTQRQSWWRRLLPRRGPKRLKAGERPGKPAGTKTRRSFAKANRKIRAGIAITIIGCGVLYGAYPPLKHAVDDRVGAVRKKVSNFAQQRLSPEHPVSVSANAQVKTHPGTYAADEITNTYWLAPFDQDARPSLNLTFGKTIALRKMIITVGATKEFVKYHRPAVLELSFSNDTNQLITLTDTPKPQQFSLERAVGVKSVRITVLDVHQAQAAKDVAISEIELFGVG